ncbi:MAG: hypothetical protein IV104_10755 [Acidovorax sp.]|nr:hypothetical protein [Acidovorax sp.]
MNSNIYIVFGIAIFLPFSVSALTRCGALLTGGYTENIARLEEILNINSAPNSAEDVSFDYSEEGCSNYLSITGRVGSYRRQSTVVDIYWADYKKYRKNDSGVCQKKADDANQPPVVDPLAGTFTGDVIYCASHLSAGATLPITKNRNPSPPQSCEKNDASTPNPVFLPTGEKYLKRIDWIDHAPHSLTVKRTYLSSRRPNERTWGSWTHNFEERLSIIGRTSEGPNYVRVFNENEKGLFFEKSGGMWHNTNGYDKLLETSNGWQRIDEKTQEISNYNSVGIIRERVLPNGWKYVYTHSSDGYLQSVTNAFGKTLTFDYLSGSGSVSIKTNGVEVVNYRSNGEQIDFVTYPDGTGEGYSYTNVSLISSVTDASGNLLDSFFYDSEDRATTTSKPLNVEKYVISYNGDGSVKVRNPIGSESIYSFLTKNGEATLVSSNRPRTDTYQRVSTRSMNSAGLLNVETDFLGTSTAYQWDTTRRLPVTVTEAVGKAEARTAQVDWHPQWRLPVKVTEQGLVVSYTYDILGNPLTQTIADTTSGGSSRTTSWTYHPSGLVATEKAPNGAVTSYQYDSAGNLTTVTNALGHVDTYTHDAAGRVLTHTAPTGLVTTYTYDVRGRMLTINWGGPLIALTYSPSGQVATATLPHGHAITYTYDAAQRLTGWSDNRGNSGSYTLDAMGNRTREEVRNAQGQLAWLLARSINGLNLVESTTVGGQQTTTWGFDANADTVRGTNGANETTQLSLDALRRVKAITNAANATASLSYNALDAVTQASDFKGVATTYARDALGNATSETSPDTGLQSAQYDALGLPSTVTDALGQATHIERDLLGRPTLITQPGGATATLRYDLRGGAYNASGQPNASKGFLSEIVDASGTTAYRRDLWGRVTLKTQTLANGDVRRVRYSYTASGQLDVLGYPSGNLGHHYDVSGQLVSLSWNGKPLVSNLTWTPLGQPTSWSWSFADDNDATTVPASRSYDSAGQLITTEFSSYQYNSAGRIIGLSQKLWEPANTNPASTTIREATRNWTVQYDPVGRITQMGDSVRTATYQYDSNGNRTASVQTSALGGTVPTSVVSRNYGTAAGHNRLLGFEQTAQSGGNSAATSVNYQYNAAGDLTHDGLRSYAYDSQGRMESATTGDGADAPKTKYAHNALGQRVFKTEPLYSAAGKPASTKNLNNLLADDDEPAGSNAEQGFMQQLVNFFSKLWSPSASDAEKLGWAYVYAEDGSLLGEYGEGSAATSGSSQYIYLPTASGPMPTAAIVNGRRYAVHSDHLNTPRRLTQSNGRVAWQWAYSAFGDEQPTTAAKRFTSETTNPTTGTTSIPDVAFNLRYPGQYFDKETGLHYNYFRTYAPSTGRYTQGDPIGLDGGFNRFAYVGANPLKYVDPLGLFTSDQHIALTIEALWSCGFSAEYIKKLAYASAAGDWMPSWSESQSINNAPWHAMTSYSVHGNPGQVTSNFISEKMQLGSISSIGRAIHAAQDAAAGGHAAYQLYHGRFDLKHFLMDAFPSKISRDRAIQNTRNLFDQCGCRK